MVGMIDIDGVCTIQLLSEQDAHHTMWQSQTGQANQTVALCFERWLQAICTADDKHHMMVLGLPVLQFFPLRSSRERVRRAAAWPPPVPRHLP